MMGAEKMHGCLAGGIYRERVDKKLINQTLAIVANVQKLVDSCLVLGEGRGTCVQYVPVFLPATQCSAEGDRDRGAWAKEAQARCEPKQPATVYKEYTDTRTPASAARSIPAELDTPPAARWLLSEGYASSSLSTPFYSLVSTSLHVAYRRILRRCALWDSSLRRLLWILDPRHG